MKKILILLLFGIFLTSFVSSYSWVANSTIIAGLPDIGTFSAPEVFYKDGFLYMLTGNVGGVVYGFVRSGDTWVANTTINASADTTQLPSVFYNGTFLYKLGGDGIGRYNGSVYSDGIGWVKNATINNTLTQGIDEDMRPSVFRYGSDLFMLSGSVGGFITGKVWVGGGWSSNLTINASIGGIGDQLSGTSPEVFYKDGFLWAIVGDSSGNFSGFLRDGDTWVANTTINASLSKAGEHVVPSVFNISGTFYMINGEQSGGWNGSVFKDITSPNITLPFYTNGTKKSNTNTLTLNVSVTDTGSTLSACNIEINGTNTTLSISSGWCNTTSIPLTGLADGNRIINVYANDSANNWGLNNSFVVLIDSKPSITINNPTGTKANQNVSFNFTILTGSSAELDVCRYNVTNNAETQTLVSNTYLSCSDLFDAKTIADGTNHKVNVFANDTANNINVTQGLFSVDTSSPTAEFGTNPANNVDRSNSSVTFDLRGYDGISISYLALYGNWTGSWVANQTNTSPINATYWNITVDAIPNGKWIWAGWVNDSGNNQVFTSSNRTITIDTVAPTITLPFYVNGTIKRNIDTLTLNISVSDVTTSPSACKIDINGTNQTVSVSSGWCNITNGFLTNLADGNRTINVYANDTVNLFGVNNSFVVFVDTTPPLLTAPVNASIDYKIPLSVDFDATDSGTGINTSTWTVNDTTNFQINSTGGLTNVTPLRGGVYVVNVSVKDLVGNINNSIYRVTVNTIVPALSLSVTNATYPSQGVINASESNTGDSDLNYTLYINSILYNTGSTINILDDFASATYTIVYNTSGGTNYTSASETKLLNIATSSDSCNVQFNETSPIIYPKGVRAWSDCTTTNTLYENGTSISNNSIRILSVGLYNYTTIRTDNVNYSNIADQEDFTISKGTLSGVLGGTTPIEYNIAGNVQGNESNAGDGDVNYTLYRNNTLVANPDTSTLSVGLYSYKYNTTASGGTNWSASSSLATFDLTVQDTTAPTITLPFYTNGTIRKNTDTITLNISVTDAGIGINGSSVCKIEANGTNTTIAISSGWCNTTTISLTGLGDGNRTINVHANDSLGNIGLNNSFVVTIDTTAPTITLPFYTNSTYKSNTSTLTLNISITDTTTNPSACKVDINGTNQTYTVSNGWCNMTDIALTNLANENYSMKVYANDTANVFGVNNSFYVNLDSINPIVVINSPTGTKTSQNVSFNFTITDAISLSICRYNVTNNAETQTLVSNTYLTCTDLFDAKTIADGTNHKVNVFANDTAENYNVTQGLFSVDTSTPGGGGGGGGAGTKELTQAENFSITTTNRQSNLDVILSQDSVKSREKEFLIINKGIEELTINIECDTTDVNKSSRGVAICDYVTLSEETFIVSPNEENPSRGFFSIKTPEDAETGEVYYFNLLAKTTDKFSKLSVSARVTNLGIIYKWSYLPLQEDKPEEERSSYPVLGISIILSLILFTLSLLIFRRYKMYASGFFISLGLMIILTGILLISL